MKNKKILSLILVAAVIAVGFSAFLCLPPVTAEAVTREVANTNDSGAGSLREAITSAQAGDVISFSKTAFPENWETAIVLNTELPYINKSNVTIQGHLQPSGNPAVAIQRSTAPGTLEFRILTVDIDVGSRVKLYGLKISGGKTNNHGGGVFTSGPIVLENCIISNNTSTSSGGGIGAIGEVTIENCRFEGNTATSHGGGVFAFDASVTAKSCVFTDNTATSGGGVYSAGTFVAANTMVTKNKTGGYYGAIETPADVYLYHCTVAGNTGSGIHVFKEEGDKVYAYNSIFAGNSVGQVGYGLYGFGARLPIGGSYLIEGSNTVTYAQIFGENIPDAKGILCPAVGGVADKSASALTAAALTGSGLSSITIFASDLEGAPRSTTGLVNYGAVEKTNILVTKITISGAPASMKIGATATLKATVTPSNATNKAVTWKSSNTSIATVDTNGKVTAKKPGTVTITATAKDRSGVKADCKITVLPLVSKIVITGAPAEMVMGKSATLKATVTPSNAGDKSMTWSSSNTKVAKVDQNGKVSAIGAGKVTIKAAAKDGSGKSASVTITVHQYVTMRIGKTTAIMNGVKTSIDDVGTKPFVISGKTMLPLRFVGEKIGGTVLYKSDSQPITLTYGNTKVEFRLGNKQMKVITGSTTQTITLDVAAQKVGAKTYIPLRAIGQALGFDVYYESGTEYIVVNNPKMTPAVKAERLAEARKVIK